MTEPLSEEKIRSLLPDRAACEFETVILRGAIPSRSLKQVRASYKQWFSMGDSERKAFRHLKEFIREELRNNPQHELEV